MSKQGKKLGRMLELKRSMCYLVLLWLVLLQMQRFWDLLTSQGLAYGPLYSTLHDAIYLVDVVWATFGYALSCTLLDSHVRSVEPTILGEGKLCTVCLGCIRLATLLVLGKGKLHMDISTTTRVHPSPTQTPKPHTAKTLAVLPPHMVG